MGYTPLDEEKVGSLVFVPLDLADLASVEAAAREIAGRTERIDVLFANAGIMAVPEGQRTRQSYPLQFGTNVSWPGVVEGSWRRIAREEQDGEGERSEREG